MKSFPRIIFIAVWVFLVCGQPEAMALFDGPNGINVNVGMPTGESVTNEVVALNTIEPIVENLGDGNQFFGLPPPSSLPTNNIPASYLSLTNIEMRTNAILDQLVSDFDTNGLALFQYVLNHVDFRGQATLTNRSLKGALGCYLEGEGNETDLSSLTIYLLRRCGIPSAYGFVPKPVMLTPDWYQVYGFELFPPDGDAHFISNQVSTIVYAFVSLDGVSTNWVPLVPWYKKRAFYEGPELRSALTNGLTNGVGIVDGFVRRNAGLEASVSNTLDVASEFLHDYLRHQLLQSQPHVSVDELGVRWRLVEQPLTNWNMTFNIALVTNTIITASADLPDTWREKVSISVSKSGGGFLFSNVFNSVEMHNRRVVVSFQPATPADWLKATNGLYSAGTNVNLVGLLSLGASPQFSEQVVTGSPAQTVKLGQSVITKIDQGQRTFPAGNVECYVFNLGQVTPDMLDQHTQILQDLSTYTKTATNLLWSEVPAVKLLGDQLCTVGMGYYLLLSQSERVISEWTKTRSLGFNHVSSFYFDMANFSNQNFRADAVSIDAFNLNISGINYLHAQGSATSTTEVYRMAEPYAQERDYFSLFGLAMTTLERAILRESLGFEDALSSDFVLRKVIEGGGFITNLTASTYSLPVNRVIISNVAADVYAEVTTFFAGHPNGRVWFPSRGITNGTYKGYGWLEMDTGTNQLAWQVGFKIAGGNHGGRSTTYSDTATGANNLALGNPSSFVSTYAPPSTMLTLTLGSSVPSIDYFGANPVNNVSAVSAMGSSSASSATLDSYIGVALGGYSTSRDYLVTPVASFYTPSITPSVGPLLTAVDQTAYQVEWESGFLAPAQGFISLTPNSFASDPVDTRSGAFYVDDADLLVSGPRPIEFRRAYSSLYPAKSEFGYGWRFNHTAFLVINTNGTEIRAVEPDGTVLRYTNVNSALWVPSIALNDRIANQTQAGIGGTANPYAKRIEKVVVGSATNYLLKTPDGECRTYTMTAYPDGDLQRRRPYLTRWEDANGNALTYVYGAQTNHPEYGKIKEIHNDRHFVRLKYNQQGRLRRVLCSDGRVLEYAYTTGGDLASVERPDGSFVRYEYEELPVERSRYIAFDGATAIVRPAVSNSAIANTFTIECWMLAQDNHEIDTASTSGTTGVSGQRYLLYPDHGGAVNGGVGISAGLNGISVYEHGASYLPPLLVYTGALNRGWVHVAVVYSNKQPRLYLNGTLVATGLTSPRVSVYPGRDWGGGTYGYFSGQFDDARIWRTARTQSQIQDGMENPPATNDTSLAAWWSFNAGTALDLSTNANHATLIGQANPRTDTARYSTHLITREIKPGGRILVNTYDDERRVVAQEATIGLSATPERNATFTYQGDGMNGRTIISNIFGAATIYDYTNGLVYRVTDALGYAETNVWDANHNLVEAVDKRGVITRYRYDALGNATNILLIGDLTGDGTITTSITWMTYTTNRQIASRSSPRGDVTRYVYDAQRNLITQQLCFADTDPWNPDNNPVYRTDTFQYRTEGWLTNKIIGADSTDPVASAFVYDADGHLVQTRLDPGHGQPVLTTTLSVNPRGWVLRRTDGLGHYTTFAYDAMGRVVEQADYDVAHTLLDRQRFTYDENGNRTLQDGPRENLLNDAITRSYDRMNRLVSSTRNHYALTNSGTAYFYLLDGASTTRAVYDGFGNLIEQQDANGHTTRHRHDALGQPIATTNFQGQTTPLASMRTWYDGGGLVISNTTPRGYVVRRTLNVFGKPSLLKHADDAVEQWRYDLAGQVTQHLDPRNISTVFQYDEFGRLTNRIEAANTLDARTNAMQYDVRGNLIRTTDAQGFVTTNRYDRANRLLVAIGATGPSPQIITSNRYDAASRFVSAAGPLSLVTNQYDGIGRLTNRAWHTVGNATPAYREAYDYAIFELNDGQRTIANGEFTIQLHDEAGRTAAEIYSDFSRKLIRYDASGNATQHVDELNRSTAAAFDGLHRKITHTTPDNITVTYQYDPDGNATNVLQPYGVQYTRSYDPRGRVTAEKIASATATLLDHQYHYDAVGNLTTQTTARGVARITTYDGLNRPLTVAATANTPAIPPVTQTFAYTANGWMQQATEAGRIVARHHDQHGRLLIESNTLDAFTAAITLTYDAEGRRHTAHVSPANQSWTNHWNGHHRITNIAWNGNYAFRYDAQSRIDILTGPYLKYTNEWGIRGRLFTRYNRRVTDNFLAYAEGYGYLQDNHRAYHEVIYGSDFIYNLRNFAYDANRQLTGETFENANTNIYTYDAAHTRTNHLKHTATGLWQRAATVDPLRRLVTENGTLAGSNPVITLRGYVENSTNVLINLNGTNLGYAIVDTNTHMWRLGGVTLSGGTNTITATGDPNELWATNVTSAVTLNLNVRGSYVYDADGNLVYMNRGNRDCALAWDALGRLAHVTVRDGAGHGFDWTASYDALGRRVMTSTQPISNHLAVGSAVVDTSQYDPNHALMEIQRTGSSTNVYLYGPDLSGRYGGVGGIGGLLAGRVNGTNYQAISDGRGNVIGVVAASGAVSYHPRYTSFGSVSNPPATWPGYATRRHDPTGFIYMGARYYDPVTGRFLSPDPMRYADSRNLYAYVANDPINNVDPDGKLSSSYQNTISASANYAGDSRVDFSGRGLNDAVALDQNGGADMLLGGAALTLGTGVAIAASPIYGVLGAVDDAYTIGQSLGQYAAAPSLASAGNVIANSALALINPVPGRGAAGASELVAAKSAGGAADEMVTVYRGVHGNHPQFQSAIQGRAAPWGGHADAALHNSGNNQSVFTSWSTDYRTAVDFALQEGPGGVVLKQTVPRSSLITSPDVFKEFEVLRTGPIQGATPIILSP